MFLHGFFLAFTLLIFVNMYACARTHTHNTHTHIPWHYVEVRGQFSVVTVLYPPCGFPGSSTGSQSWQQASVFNEPSHQPFFVTSDGLCGSIYKLCVYFLASHWDLFPLSSVYFILLMLIAALQDWSWRSTLGLTERPCLNEQGTKVMENGSWY